ncbi:MAG: tetratricopeptide repeat protein [Clostridia bacterium]|nr:tetratricopeptide repeat protein [Clostridia bacterium]
MVSWLSSEDADLAQGVITPVPQQRIREKLDQYMSRRDYAAVERHLLYWLEEARQGHDLRGELMIRNEMIGHYRKTGDRESALASANAALDLLDALGFSGTVSAGTTYVNVATAMCAFDMHTDALPLFEKAKAVYEAGDTEPQLLGGLYNNMALACASTGRYDEAYTLFDRAMACMKDVRNGVLEQAITCLNRADCVAAESGPEASEARVYALLDQASELLSTPGVPHDGYYAFVCEKCAPVFEYYGYFLDAEHLKREAERIYEGT